MSGSGRSTVECERCGNEIEHDGELAKCDECGWYEWWPNGEPEKEAHPGW